ncbi:MAG: hypothetical protein AB8B83_00495 [Bdellovibrionales bacterium]
MMRIFSISALFAMALSASPAHADNKGLQAQCDGNDRSISVYGHDICPMPEADQKDLKDWDEMTNALPSILPEHSTSEKAPAELCDHVSHVGRLYARDAEIHILRVVNKLAEIADRSEPLKAYLEKFEDFASDFESPAYIAVNQAFLSYDTKNMAALLTYFPEREHGYILRVRKTALSAKHLVTVGDASLDVCYEHAQEKGLRKIVNPEEADVFETPKEP